MNIEKLKKMEYVEAPNQENKFQLKVFLAGSIDKGKASNWQEKFKEELSPFPITLFNPRRKFFPEGKKPLKEQIFWEMEKLSASDVIIFNFQDYSSSPITLLELGAFHKNKKIFVYADKYYRKENVMYFCQHNNILFYEDEKLMLSAIKQYLKLKTYMYSVYET